MKFVFNYEKIASGDNLNDFPSFRKLYNFLKGKKCFLFFVFLGVSTFSYAHEGNLVANFLCDRAQGYIQKGERKQAIEAFSKVLLLDPENEIAKKNLKMLGASDRTRSPFELVSVHYSSSDTSYSSLRNSDGRVSANVSKGYNKDRSGSSTPQRVNSPARTQLSLNSKPTQEMRDFKKQESQLKLVQNQLEQTQQQLKEQSKLHTDQVQKFQGLLAKKADTSEKMNIRMQEKWTALKDTVKQTDRKLDKLNDEILMRDLDLLNCESMLVMKDKEIFQLKNTLHRTLQIKKDQIAEIQDLDATSKQEDFKLLHLKEEIDTFKDKINEHKLRLVAFEQSSDSEGDSQLKSLVGLIKEKDEDIARLKEELVSVKKEISAFQKNPPTPVDQGSQGSSSDTNILKQEIKNVLSELNEKEKLVAELKIQLDENQQRQDLSQKIIQEKDAEIKKLNETLQTIKNGNEQ